MRCVFAIRPRSLCGTILLVLCGACCTARAEPRPPQNYEKTFKQIKGLASRQLRSADPGERLAGVQKLAECPTAGSAEILLKLGCDSNDGDVRDAAYRALVPLIERSDICDVATRTVKEHLRKGAANRSTSAALLLLMRSGRSEAAQRTDKLLALAAAAPPAVRLFVVPPVDALAAQNDEQSLASVIRISKSDVFKNTFAVRRAVIESLAKNGTRDAVDSLVDMLGQVRGEALADVVRYLIGISGESHGPAPQDWQSWWQANRAAYQTPTRQISTKSIEIPNGTTAHFYGLPVYGERVVFVIDTSKSMDQTDGRLEIAKRELVSAILDLPDEATFDVLTFNADVRAWSPVLMPANVASRLQAAKFVNAQTTVLQTVIYDALEAALSFDAEAIYLLTDGEPVGGKITEPNEIVKEISRLNRQRRVSIHCIGVGPSAAANAFLKNLSDKNWGTFRRAAQ